MPTLSASDYTNYLKYKAAAQTGIRPGIQTRDNVTLQPSVLTANVLTSQASLVVNPSITKLVGNARVNPIQPSYTNNPKNLSTVSWSSGSSITSTTSSKTQQPGGLPANNVVGTYTRIPQNAGWVQGNMISSGPKRF
jgi:hypothetical protein